MPSSRTGPLPLLALALMLVSVCVLLSSPGIWLSFALPRGRPHGKLPNRPDDHLSHMSRYLAIHT